jgi:integrase
VPDDAPVFARLDGTPWPPDSISGVWQRVARNLGLKVRLHDLRHPMATIMLSMGVPTHEVSARLGHATAGFTLTTCAHVLPGAQAEAAERLAALLNGKPALPAA